MVFAGAAQMHQLRSKIGTLDVKLSNSFSNVREDIDNLYSWVEFLKDVMDSQSENFHVFTGRLDSIDSQMGHIGNIYRNIERLDSLMRRFEGVQNHLKSLGSSGADPAEIARLGVRIDDLAGRISSMAESVDTIRIRVSGIDSELANAPSRAPERPVERQPYIQPRQQALHPKTMPRLQEKVMRSVARSSKDFLKATILSMIKRDGEISALALRESIVENQGIASKSTFYRILEELDEEGSIEMVRVGKEKHCFHVETRKA